MGLGLWGFGLRAACLHGNVRDFGIGRITAGRLTIPCGGANARTSYGQHPGAHGASSIG